MKPEVPVHLLRQAMDWEALHRWERRRLGLALRQIGLTFSEIRQVIPVPKSTLSNWCAGVRLTTDQVRAITERSGPDSRIGIPRDTQWQRREVVKRMRAEARVFARDHLDDPMFVGGVVLYWGEGSKTRNYLDLTNSDPAALRVFVRWVRLYLDADARFVLSLHLHHGNDEAAARRYWTDAVGLPDVQFTKAFIKPPGTGHRKNHLVHGVCRVRTRNASDHWNRVMVWIQVVSDELGPISNAVC